MLFENDDGWSHPNHVIFLLEFSLNTNPKWPVIVSCVFKFLQRGVQVADPKTVNLATCRVNSSNFSFTGTVITEHKTIYHYTLYKKIVFPKLKIVQCIHKKRRSEWITDFRALWQIYTPPGDKPLKFFHFYICFNQGFYISRIRKVAELMYCIGSPYCGISKWSDRFTTRIRFFFPQVTRDLTSESLSRHFKIHKKTRLKIIKNAKIFVPATVISIF